MRLQTLPAATVRTHARSTDPALILLAEVHPDRDSHFDDNLHAASLCPAQHLRATAGRAKPQDSSRYLSGNFFIIPAFIVYPVSGNSVRRNILTLAFAPGECAQVDWGCAGSMAVGSTRRRLSFFVMVLCYSRLCYVEFSLGEATEHFLSAHQNAFEFLGGVPFRVLIDFVPRNKIDEHSKWNTAQELEGVLMSAQEVFGSLTEAKLDVA